MGVRGDIGALAPAVYAEAIGQLIISWSHLDFAVEQLIMKLSDMDPTVGSVVFGHIDFREKLAIAKSLGFIKQPNDEWFSFLEKTLARIDNDLRPYRNRLVHDSWSFMFSGPAVRQNREPKLIRPQSRERVLETLRSEKVSPEDIAKRVKWVKFALGALDLLRELPLTSRTAYPWECLQWE